MYVLIFVLSEPHVLYTHLTSKMERKKYMLRKIQTYLAYIQDNVSSNPIQKIYDSMVVTCLDVCIIYFISCDWIMNSSLSYMYTIY
jgi:hypothetical protein